MDGYEREGIHGERTHQSAPHGHPSQEYLARDNLHRNFRALSVANHNDNNGDFSHGHQRMGYRVQPRPYPPSPPGPHHGPDDTRMNGGGHAGPHPGPYQGHPRFSGRGRMPGGRGQPSPVQAGGRGDAERGQGYRKLWQQVTKVGRGQRLGDNNETVPFSDMTVEDLLRIIRSLPPEESAVQAVSRGLYYLDSRALAALLKELHKLGLSNRASELFDWLRGLAEGHELAALCDVYTYTTIISQCGSHQQLRKALELVAEMRGRGIPCNVHTYSALMNVCIKANELELALDVYGQLLQDGCTPNLVTYNILIDVHGKTGQWQEAVKVLDALDLQGVKAEVRTYNTIINACNRSGQPEYALKVYERMLADGVQPTATTYTALISAYGKTGKVEEAVRVFQDMVQRGCERNVITYSSLITACERAGRWEMALELFEEMHREGCKPNVVTYNALLAACGQAGQWKAALEVFESMSSTCKPDAVTYGTLISAFDRGHQWGRALQVLEDMQTQGHRPDAVVFNLVIETLTRSGIQSAQLKAVQLFLAATRQGQLRMTAQGPSEVTVAAFTVGTATLCVLQWLADLRLKAPQQLSGTSERAALLLLKGKHVRAESPPHAILDSVSRILASAHVPAETAITSQGIRMEVEVGPGTEEWLLGEEVAGLCSCLSVGPTRKLLTESIVLEDQAVEKRCAKAFAAVKEFEDSHPLAGHAALLNSPGPPSRPEAVGELVSLGRSLGLHEDTIHDSVQLLDRLTLMGLHVQHVRSRHVLAAIALISAGQGDRADRLPSDDVVVSATQCSAAMVKEAKQELVAALHSGTGAISALRILHLYLERLGCDFQDQGTVSRLAGDALHMMGEVIFRGDFLEFPPSLVAAAVLVSARRAAGTWPFWPSSLLLLTGHQDPTADAFGEAVRIADEIVQLKAPPPPVERRQQVSPRNSNRPPVLQHPPQYYTPGDQRRSTGPTPSSPVARPRPGGPPQRSPHGRGSGPADYGRQNGNLPATLSP